MKKEELEAFTREAAKGIKTEEDLNDFRAMLTKVTLEAALNAEMEEHLGPDRAVVMLMVVPLNKLMHPFACSFYRFKGFAWVGWNVFRVRNRLSE